jgi:predicted O-methyltransferase YrrM
MKNFTMAQLQRLIEQSLLEEPTGNDFLDARYQEQISIIGHTNPYYKLMYLLAKELKPALSVELGSWQATAASHLAIGNPEGKVVTIDIHREDKPAQQRCYEAVAYCGNLTYINGWSWDVVDQVKALNQPIDILYIDAWHDIQYTTKEWDLYSPLLNSPALVIGDDITADFNFEGMREWWDKLPGEKILDPRLHPGIPFGLLKFVRGK